MGEKSSALLQAVNYNGAPCEKPIQSLQCELVSEITRATVMGSLERRGQSQYEISYQPTIKGMHQLHIKVEDQHIRGSPFPVAVNLPIEKLCTPILAIGGVQVLNSDLTFSSSFGKRGSGKGQFNRPQHIACDRMSLILTMITFKSSQVRGCS